MASNLFVDLMNMLFLIFMLLTCNAHFWGFAEGVAAFYVHAGEVGDGHHHSLNPLLQYQA